MKNVTRVCVSLSDDERTATVKMSSRSAPVVCGVLGVENSETGRVVYLDCRIHRTDGGRYEGWQPSGAITTILREELDIPISASEMQAREEIS